MPRRKRDVSNDTQVIFRTTDELKNKIDAAADAEGITTAEWLRRLVEREFGVQLCEKTNRDNATAELEKRMTALEQQIRILSQPYITQNAGRDAKMNVTKE